ncbi:MAG: SPFH domain-containing protein [Candidatus Portnoybacteria bacterium]|nr:SPFH domain-containing protein [Candidatus Portnoybacteria bacterium]MDD4982823.1 SPFH domain-containing protein [Candidatus Portnoybacteria bacterium]
MKKIRVFLSRIDYCLRSIPGWLGMAKQSFQGIFPREKKHYAIELIFISILIFCSWRFVELRWGFAALGAAWAVFCIKIIGPTEKAIGIFLGEPSRELTSGIRFIFWPLEKLAIYPTKQQEVELNLIEVITKKVGRAHSSAAITIKPTFYFFWPDKFEKLKQALEKGANPDKDSVKDLFQEAIFNALRSVIIQYDWETCYSERDKITQEVLGILCCSGPIQAAGIEKEQMFLAIEVFLPKDLVANINAPEIAALKAAAKKEEAEGEKAFAIAQKQAEAEGRKLVFASIGDEMAKEALFTLREMAKGTSNTILFGLPPELYETVKAATRGADIDVDHLLKVLTKEQKKKIVEAIANLGKKGDTT